MQKVSYTVSQALQVLKQIDEPGLSRELVPLLIIWLESVREYALDYEQSNQLSNSPFSQYRTDFRYPLAFSYAIVAYGKYNNVACSDERQV